MCCGCGTSYIVSVHIKFQASIYTLSLCRGHSWRVRLAKQETLTPPGIWSHLWFARVHECPLCALLLVPQWQCISSFAFYIVLRRRRSHGVRRNGLSRRKQRLNRSLDDLLRIAKNNGRHELLHALSYIPVSRLKPILDEADRRSLRHSDWFKLKMIMAFSFNKRFPRIPALPPKTQFIKIKFVNQGLDLLNISNIFRDHRVTSKIPRYFENLDPPLICYQYKILFEILFSTTTKKLLILMFWVPFSHHDIVRTRLLCIHLLDMLSQVTLLVFLTKDYGHSLRKGLTIDFHPGLILLNAGILSRMHCRRIVNVGPKRKAPECMPLTTGKMNFYGSVT